MLFLCDDIKNSTFYHDLQCVVWKKKNGFDIMNIIQSVNKIA